MHPGGHREPSRTEYTIQLTFDQQLKFRIHELNHVSTDPQGIRGFDSTQVLSSELAEQVLQELLEPLPYSCTEVQE